MMRMKKKILVSVLMLMILVLSIFVIAQQEWPAFNVCCEKTSNGAWCQNTLEEDCDTSTNEDTGSPYRMTPSSCDATSFCKLGCCIDTEEGVCMKNSPKKVCEISKGTWIEDEKCRVAQCDLGCCVLGDQASFVTLTRCKRLSRLYGLETNFKQEITSEPECILVAYSQDKGACTYEFEDEKTCKFTTREECTSTQKGGNITSETEFFVNYLCSADELATNCGPSEETMCVAGKEEVYFKDTCGNPANIYDADRIYANDPSYWQKIVPKHESCGYQEKNGQGNIGSETCGNCKYLHGSLCAEGDATYGDNACRDLNCYNTKNGNHYKNGESWCEYQGEKDNGLDLVGSRHFRHICIHGEEIVEPCADFRNEICIEEQFSVSSGDFIEAACRVNRWTDCIDQFTEKDCLNTDKRECFWLEGYHYDATAEKENESLEGGQEEFGTSDIADEDKTGEEKGIITGGGICLPDNPPGFKFWEGRDSQSVCSLGNSLQKVTYHINIFGSKSCEENCEVLEAAWVNDLNRICTSLGDCGAYSNFIGAYTNDGVVVKDNGKRRVAQGILSSLKR